MIVLFWEFFLINPNNRLKIEVDRAILYSSVLIGFLLICGHQNDAFIMLSRGVTRNTYTWRLWNYLLSPFYLLKKLYPNPKSDSTSDGITRNGSLKRYHFYKGYRRSFRGRKRRNGTVRLITTSN